MKKKQELVYKFVIGFVCLIVAFASCTDELSKAGLGLLPTGDLVTIRKTTVKDIQAYTVSDEKQRTDEPGYNLLGTYVDPIFGKTTADFACQFRLTGFPDFSKNAQPDSLVLYLLYMDFYGDTITPQKLNVYELTSDLDIDLKYYQDINLKALAGTKVGEINYLPKLELWFDSLKTIPTPGSSKTTPKDTVIQEIAIKLNASLTQKLLAADEATWSDNDKFMAYFKGLYVEASDLNQGGAIMNIYTLASGSRMVLHYHNSEKDSLVYNFNINDNAARVNRFVQDYSSTDFVENLDKLDVQDDKLYIQSTGGLRSKIFIPSLGNWSDSTDYAINQAELIFQIDTIGTDVTKQLPHERLLLAAIAKSVVDQKDSAYYLSDYAFSPQYFGGTYNKTDHTYRFNIAKHLQDIISKKEGKENLGFYLESTVKNSIYRRTVLEGITNDPNKSGIRLEVTYSKIK